MLYTSGLLALASLAVQVTAAPASNAIPAGAFSAQQVDTGNKVFLSGPIAMMKTYQKYNKPVPAAVMAAAAAAATQSGTVKANPTSYDSEYLCPVTVGSNSMTMDFDTGSSDFWVFSTLMPSSEQSGHHIYNPATSGAKESGETWKISYGDGSGASGTVYADKVVIGGVTATSMDVEAATSASSSFVQGTSDGLVGLAFPNINTCTPNQCTPFMQKILSTLPSKVFTASLKKGKAGSYDFGYIDSSKYTGSITYTSVNTANGFWEFSISGYKVGSTSYTESSGDSIADTGTTLLYLPNDVINNYWGTVSGAQNNANAGGIIFPCSATLPNLSITISGVSHVIPGSYMNYAPYTTKYCFGGLQSSSGIGFNILGDIFLKSQFVVFDVGNTRIGIATPSSL